jgi:hypothetical protein
MSVMAAKVSYLLIALTISERNRYILHKKADPTGSAFLKIAI